MTDKIIIAGNMVLLNVMYRNVLVSVVLLFRVEIVSLCIVRGRLLEVKTHSRKLAREPKLLHGHCIARLRFAQNCVTQALVEWSTVLFYDVARISLFEEDLESVM